MPRNPALFVLLAVNIAIAVPSPGNAGTLELGAVLALQAVGVDHNRALAFALLYHSGQVLPVVLLGLLQSRSTYRLGFGASASTSPSSSVDRPQSAVRTAG